MKRFVVLLAVALALALAWAWASGSLDRAILAIRILDDLRRPEAVSWLDQARPEPEPRPLRVQHQDQSFETDLWQMEGTRSAVPLVFIPGAVTEGKDDPRVAPFARLLAQAGFAVLVPDLTSLRDLRADPADLNQVVALIRAVAARSELAPLGVIGIFGVSYSGGLAVLAALDPRVSSQVRYVATLGAYADLDSVTRFLADGRLIERGAVRHLAPDPYGRMIVARTFQGTLQRQEDRSIIDAMIERRALDASAPLDDLAARLSEQGRVIYDLFERAKPEQVPELIDRFPVEMKTATGELSPARRDFAALSARLYLAHDVHDATIPVTESLRLAKLAQAQVKVRLLVLDTVRHVAPEPWTKDLRGFLSRDLPEAWRMVGWWVHFLGER